MINEMKGIGKVDSFSILRTPVISSITDKLTTVKKETELRKVIDAIDLVTDGTKDIAEYQDGENYKVDDLNVSAADWDYIRAARNSTATNYSGEGMFIPNYSDAKEGAKEFIKFMYSDEGYRIYLDTLHIPLPLSLCEEEIDTTGWNAFETALMEEVMKSEQTVTSQMMNKSQNFCISFGDESADYNGGSYTQSTDLLIFQSTSFTSLTTPNNVNAATKGYPFGADTCDKDFTIKFSVVDSVVTASIKWIDETEFTEIIRYQVSEETPTGYVHIWTTGTSSTFDIDNLRIKNLDTKPNLVEVEYKSGLITAPPDFAYEPLEHVYEEESEEAAGFVWNDYYMIPCVAVVCILAFGIALVIKVIKQKGGKRHAQKNMEKSS